MIGGKGGMDVRLGWRTEAEGNEVKERRSWRCEKEERKDPNACEMKRIKGLHTSRRGRKMCGGRRMSD